MVDKSLSNPNVWYYETNVCNSITTNTPNTSIGIKLIEPTMELRCFKPLTYITAKYQICIKRMCWLTLISKVPCGAGMDAAGVECVEVQASSAGQTAASWPALTLLTAFKAVSTATGRDVLIVSQRTVAHTGSTHRDSMVRVSLQLNMEGLAWVDRGSDSRGDLFCPIP